MGSAPARRLGPPRPPTQKRNDPVRVSRLLTAALASALLAPAVALTASPASAATATQIDESEGPWLSYSTQYQEQPGPLMYGSSISLNITVETTSGDPVYEGMVTVQRKLANRSTWTTVISSEMDKPYIFDTIKAAGSATYRVLYSGNDEYAASDASTGVKVQRDLGTEPVDTGRKLFIKGKVKPKFKNKKVIIQRRNGSKWAKYSVVRTSRTSQFKARVVAPNKIGPKFKYRVFVPASGGFAASTSQTYIASRTY